MSRKQPFFFRLIPLCFLAWSGLALALGDEEPRDHGPMQLGHEAYVSGDFKTALQMWKPLAEQGAAQAQYYLSGLYARGEGVPKDEKAALAWLTKAAGAGYAAAQFNLANQYFQGLGVPQDFAKARHWWELAADQNLHKAAFNLGSLYYQGKGVDKNTQQALNWYRKAADMGSVEAKVVLAKLEEAGAIESIQGERPAARTAQAGSDKAAKTSDKVMLPPQPSAPISVGTPEDSATWIKAQPVGNYSIQLYAANSLAAIETFVQKIEVHDRLAIFGFARDGKPFYAVIQGSYPTAAAAKAEANRLVGVSTWVRSFNSIRKLMVE